MNGGPFRINPRQLAIQEMSDSILTRRRLIEDAKQHLVHDNHELAMRAIIRTLEHVQQSDERVMQLHRECLVLLEQAGKVLELHRKIAPAPVFSFDEHAVPAGSVQTMVSDDGDGCDDG